MKRNFLLFAGILAGAMMLWAATGPKVPESPKEVAEPGGVLPGNPKIALVKVFQKSERISKANVLVPHHKIKDIAAAGVGVAMFDIKREKSMRRMASTTNMDLGI